MKINPKILFFFLTLHMLGSTTLTNAQNSFKILDKAEALQKRGLYEQALQKIDKAEKTKYCTCGDCVFQVNKRSNLLRFEILSALNKYQQARNSLDSIFSPSTKYDSLKILTYQAELGKENLSKNILLSTEKINVSCKDEICYLEIPFKENRPPIRLKLDLGESVVYLYGNKTQSEKVKARWLEEFKASESYKLIKQDS